MKAGKDEKLGREAPVFVAQYGSAARRLCPHCHRYVFPIRDFILGVGTLVISVWDNRVVLVCKHCGKTSYETTGSRVLVWLASIAALLGVAAPLEAFSSYNEFVILFISLGVSALVHLYAINRFVKVQITDPHENALTASAELSVNESEISSVLMRMKNSSSALLFGPEESGWLWLVRLDQNFYVQLSSFPKGLKALRSKFQLAAQKSGIVVEEKTDGNEHLFLCQLGADPERAGKLAWAVFTDTMGLGRDAKVSMKWL